MGLEWIAMVSAALLIMLQWKIREMTAEIRLDVLCDFNTMKLFGELYTTK